MDTQILCFQSWRMGSVMIKDGKSRFLESFSSTLERGASFTVSLCCCGFFSILNFLSIFRSVAHKELNSKKNNTATIFIIIPFLSGDGYLLILKMQEKLASGIENLCFRFKRPQTGTKSTFYEGSLHDHKGFKGFLE
jgi:hypothetical protein